MTIIMSLSRDQRRSRGVAAGWRRADLGLLYASRGEHAAAMPCAVEAAANAVERRVPAFIGRLIRPFAPLLRDTPCWPTLLKTMILPA
jgi:hypothetical protein